MKHKVKYKKSLELCCELLNIRNNTFLLSKIIKVPEYIQGDNTQEYLIGEEDFLRNTPKESKYLIQHRAMILEYFRNQCAICSAKTNGIEMDHFLVPKMRGGNFELLHRSGHSINNAVPLCISCNRSKQAKDYREFCDKKTIKRIRSVNEMINRIINSKDSKFKKTIGIV